MESFSCHVPVEIVTQIMSWLTPKSLMRFKCLSKSWRSLINGLIKDPEFLSKHLHNTNKVLSSGTRHLFHLSNVILRENMFSLFAVSSYCADGKEKPVEFDPEILNLPIFTGVRWLGFPGHYHCNGIICLDGHNEDMPLCNPVLHSKTDDYKIVRILTSPDGAEQSYSSDSDEANDSSSPCHGAELTTLGSGIWRTIERPLDGYSLRRLCSYAYCKGLCYWITHSIESVILSFDMCEEVFRCVELPNDVLSTESHWRSDLMAWNDSLVLLFDNCRRGQRKSAPRSIDMWVMNENNAGGENSSYSWIKYLTIENLNGLLAPLTFRKSDELLMQDIDKEKFFAYSIRNKEIRDLGIDGRIENRLSYIGTHVPSLASIRDKCKL
ncbi:hypothetical protein TIFTF001_013128 [Ficus carica]|uniref:F-box domain-containing protein n=1 Tax=Ficus carica TaxID=3494 RepID=A0AA87ZX58_FICCA|nr:hypothetical protein TIFTF001_013128 [Ficus carica]